jgi:C_GCAxxG_C_C family probable redox protein
VSEEITEFQAAVQRVIDGPGSVNHCSCAEVVMELLRERLGLSCRVATTAAAPFGGGVAGSGGPCGAFSAGLIALGIWMGENVRSEGCVSDAVGGASAAYFDLWTERFSSIMCATLTGFPQLRVEAVRDSFFSGGGPQKCTDNYMRFAVETVPELIERWWPTSFEEDVCSR